jgi:hypothetical protein
VTIEITNIRFTGTAKNHESISHYRWRNIATGGFGTSDKATLVAWVATAGNRAFVSANSLRAEVGVVRPSQRVPFLRTRADGSWSDNLLALPLF